MPIEVDKADAPAASARIAPLKGWRHLGLREIWEYRDLVGRLRPVISGCATGKWHSDRSGASSAH